MLELHWILSSLRLRLVCLVAGHSYRYVGDMWIAWRHPVTWKCERCDHLEIR